MTIAAKATATPLSRIVLWGTCDTGKPRVRILCDGLRQAGIEVVQCHADVWGGIEDKSQVKGFRRWLRLLARIALVYPSLVFRYLRLPPHDYVLLAYPAIPDVFVLKPFAWLRRTPVAMDWFLSAYDTVVQDRKLVQPRHPLAWFLWLAEAAAVRMSNCLFMDTRAHAMRMERLFRLPAGRCGHVWVGVEDGIFEAVEPMATRDGPFSDAADGMVQVLFYGQFIPLHGVPVIIEAARLLRDRPIQWLLVGRGQEASRVREMLDADPLPRVRWIEWVEYRELRRCIQAVDICLGIFGTSDKAASVIPNKVFQVIAAGKPLITRDSPAIHELLGDASWVARLVPPGDPAALAEAVAAPLPPSVAPQDWARLVGRFRAGAIGRQLVGLLQATAQSASP